MRGERGAPGPSAGSGPAFDVSIRATELVVQQDCDASTANPSAAAGDFFIRVELRSVTDRSSEVIGSTDYDLVQANDGEVEVVGMQADGVFRPAPGTRLEVDVSIYENDPNDVRHFDETDTLTFEYDPASNCWIYSGDSNCLGSSGNLVSSVLRVRDGSGDPCALDLRWSLNATER